MVTPTVEYASTVWDPVNQKTSNHWIRYRDERHDLLRYKHGKNIRMRKSTRSKENQDYACSIKYRTTLYIFIETSI